MAEKVLFIGNGLNQLANHQSTICSWNAPNSQMRNVFARQAIPMTWDYAAGFASDIYPKSYYYQAPGRLVFLWPRERRQ